MQNNDKKTLNSEITMKSELKKVIWPTGKQTAKSTAVTIAFVLLITIVLVILNLFFDFISEKYYGAILGIGTEQNSGIVASGDKLSSDVVSGDVIQDLVSGDKSGEISGETDTTEPVSEVE